MGRFRAPLPILLGHEAAGVVDAVGEGVVGLDIGDHVILTPIPPCGACYWCLRGEPGVCANAAGILTNTFPDGSTGLSRGDDTVFRGVGVGAFAEHVVTLASGAVRIPREVPLDVACVIGCAVQTGVGAVLNTARVEAGATVLVMGLGGIGLSIVQGARLAGASRVIVSDPVKARRDAALAMGATDAIDPAEADVASRVHESPASAPTTRSMPSGGRRSSPPRWQRRGRAAPRCAWARRRSTRRSPSCRLRSSRCRRRR